MNETQQQQQQQQQQQLENSKDCYMADQPPDIESFNTCIPDGTGAMVIDDVSHQFTINMSMQQCLAQANAEARLIVGFSNVFAYLENRSGESILFCILPENLWNDPQCKAAFRLVAAFCDEHQVRMIKVDDDQLVRKIIERTSSCLCDDSSSGASDAVSSAAAAADLSYECALVLRRLPTSPRCDTELLRHHARFPFHDFDNLPLVRLLESS